MSWDDPNFSRRKPLATHDSYKYFLNGGNLGTVVLPKALIWQDEFTWGPVAQSYEYSVEGNFLIQESTKKKGRHITLVGHNDMAWIDREDMLKLIRLRDTAGLKMTLMFATASNAETYLFKYDVMFRHQDTALEYTLVKSFDQYETDAFYIINAIRLMEVLPNETTPNNSTGG